MSCALKPVNGEHHGNPMMFSIVTKYSLRSFADYHQTTHELAKRCVLIKLYPHFNRQFLKQPPLICSRRASPSAFTIL